MRGHRDLRLVVALAFACAVGSLITPLGAVRVIFAVPLTLILPGYALTAAAFGPRRPRRPELPPLVLGLSLACLALAGLLLNYTPGGLRGLPWAILLFLSVAVGCGIATRRRRPAGRGSKGLVLPRPGAVTALLVVGTLAMTVGALGLAQWTFRAADVHGFTQLWIAPHIRARDSARVGVTSEQQGVANYRLVVEIEGRPSPIVRTFTLAPSRRHVLRIDNRQTASPVRFEAKLYLRSRPDKVYRRVFGWLGGDRSGPRGS